MKSFKIFIPTLIQILLTSLLNYYNIDALLILFIMTFFFTIIIILTLDTKYNHILLITYTLRVILMIFDIYYSNIFKLPHTGDSKDFYLSAIDYMYLPSIFKYDLYGGNYSKILGAIFKITGPNRVISQHINILLGILSIVFLIKIFNYLNIEKKYLERGIYIYSLLPMNMIISSVLMRESFIIFFVSLSLLYFVKYSIYKMNYCLVLSLIFLFISSSFHSGTIAILVGYACFFISDLKKINDKKVIILFLGILLSIFILKNFSTIFFKFYRNGNLNFSYTNHINVAGSIYLKSFKINKVSDIFKYGFIRAIYFLFSPTPLYWRNFSDVFSFCFDSVFYIIVFYRIIKYIFKEKQKERFLTSILISALVFVFVFGIGVNNAGTAIRHRNKILIFFVTINYLIVSKSKRRF